MEHQYSSAKVLLRRPTRRSRNAEIRGNSSGIGRRIGAVGLASVNGPTSRKQKEEVGRPCLAAQGFIGCLGKLENLPSVPAFSINNLISRHLISHIDYFKKRRNRGSTLLAMNSYIASRPAKSHAIPSWESPKITLICPVGFKRILLFRNKGTLITPASASWLMRCPDFFGKSGKIMLLTFLSVGMRRCLSILQSRFNRNNKCAFTAAGFCPVYG